MRNSEFVDFYFLFVVQVLLSGQTLKSSRKKASNQAENTRKIQYSEFKRSTTKHSETQLKPVKHSETQ